MTIAPPTTSTQLRELCENLASAWNGGSTVLRELRTAAGNPDRGPIAALNRLGENGIPESLAQDSTAIAKARDQLETYVSGPTWYDQASRENPALGRLRQRPVAYFCAEFGLADWLPIYSGGLGILAGDVLKEASDLGLPLVGIGLFYNHGYFTQMIDGEHQQIESYARLDQADLPFTEVLAADGQPLRIRVPIRDHEVWVAAWRVQVGRTALYLLDTDIAANAEEQDRAITQGLYAGGQDTRVRQEIVLGVGGVRMLRALGIDPGIFSMNEGHAAFLALELLREELSHGSWDDAVDSVRRRVVYTNHTVVPAGNDVFGRELVLDVLGPYMETNGVPPGDLLALAGHDSFSMALLAFSLSGKANAVSHIHADAIRQRQEWRMFPVEAVTNGVHVPSWLGEPVQALLDRHVPDWSNAESDWGQLAAVPDEELWAARRSQRAALVEYLRSLGLAPNFNSDVLTIVWARRFAQYKRAGLLVSDAERLARIVSQEGRPVQVVVAGKSHPKDTGGKQMLTDLLKIVEGDDRLVRHVVFVPNYNMDIALKLTAGADIWLNTPRKPLEASGTSGMKAGDNGALHLTVTDGWAAEVDWNGVGWPLDGLDDADDASRIYQYLENEIVPMFYDRPDSGLPTDWLARVKRSMAITLAGYSAQRMVLDYLNRLYLPLLEQQESSGQG